MLDTIAVKIGRHIREQQMAVKAGEWGRSDGKMRNGVGEKGSKQAPQHKSESNEINFRNNTTTKQEKIGGSTRRLPRIYEYSTNGRVHSMIHFSTNDVFVFLHPVRALANQNTVFPFPLLSPPLMHFCIIN